MSVGTECGALILLNDYLSENFVRYSIIHFKDPLSLRNMNFEHNK